MKNFTTNTYEIKRKIINFTEKITDEVGQVERKFIQDTIYGICKSKSILLSDISDSLMESINKVNTVERLSNNLMKNISDSVTVNYKKQLLKSIDMNDPVILVDDSDVIKPYGNKFDSLGFVRDGSSRKNTCEKGYKVTEMVALTQNKKQPVSLFSKIHSAKEKEYKSTNTVTFEGLTSVINTINTKGTFIFDRGYDMNDLFKFMYNQNQDFVIRLTERRKIFFKGKWYKSTTLRDSRKGKIKTKVLFQGEEKDCYISHINCQITAAKKNMYLVLIYGLSQTPMMLATNKIIKSKEDVVKILRLYMSRWRIEEYFRFKKQEYGFENFRVRSLKSINNLNQLLTYTIGMVGILTDNIGTKRLSNNIISNAKAFKKKCLFYYYQMARGISKTLAYARNGIKEWQNIRKITSSYQLYFNLTM
ncbi:transposase [Clostridium sp. BJN0001]|uniref:transposase n=1 Tax=Clostridium sp. BJN0001 TaxID=2930219 RepID=UPI001FD41330|nr:transposase [Clostridium sp. BJN0001]